MTTVSETPTTLPELVDRCWQRFAETSCYGFKAEDGWRRLSFADARQRTYALAAALAGAGIGHGDRVAIISPTRWEWALTDYAVHRLGGVVVPVYPSLPPEQIAYILEHAGVRVVMVGGAEQADKVAAVRANLPEVVAVVSYDPVATDGVVALEQFTAGADADAPKGGPKPDDLASIIYTSGTTGPPKGVMLTHANIVSNVVACTAACPFTASDLQLSFLPLSHIFERMVHYYMLNNGVSLYLTSDIQNVVADLAEVRPTVLTSVPRVFEKVLGKVEETAAAGGLKGALTRFGIDTARAWALARYGGSGAVSPGLSLKRAVADKLVYGKVRAKLGGRTRVVVTGGAATPNTVTEFFTGVGVRVLPGYGLTESSPVIAFNTFAHFRFGTVGKPIPGTEVKIAADGEILARGPGIMLGYYQNDEQTRLALADDGFLRTGDIGQLDGDGFLSITDRKKDLLVTSQGKNVAPQPLEQSLVQDELIAQAVLLGDGRPYIAALLVPNLTALKTWAAANAVPCDDDAALCAEPRVQALFEERVAARCARFARHETVKRFALLRRELSEAEGELTPTLKVKRRVIRERYAREIDDLYRDPA